MLLFFALCILARAWSAESVPVLEPYPRTTSKKGLQVEMVDDAIALGVQHAALNLDLLTKAPRALGTGGGALNAILGSLQMVGLAALVAVPVGILGGVYVSEFAGRRSARAVRFGADVLVGVPSILIGIVAYTLLVVPFKQFNAAAGSVALGLIMVPVIVRTTEEILRLVPREIREAGLALGIPTWRVVVSVVLPAGRTGVLTGVMLAVARAAGETAPLLFTALGSRLVNVGQFGQPMDALPLFIYNGARQPIAALNEQAWGAALLLLGIATAASCAPAPTLTST